jgi:hypothetical protein
MPARTRARPTTEIGSINGLYPHKYFTEYLVDVFMKSPWESDLNQELSSLLIGRLNNYTGITCNDSHNQIRRKNRNLNGGCKHETAGTQRLESCARTDFWNQDQSTVGDLACTGSSSRRQTESRDRPWSGGSPLLRVAETGPAALTH